MLTSDVKKEDLTEGAIDDAHFTAISDNENSDGKIQNAFDDDPSTIWHTQWSPSKKELPATINCQKKGEENHAKDKIRRISQPI